MILCYSKKLVSIEQKVCFNSIPTQSMSVQIKVIFKDKKKK